MADTLTTQIAETVQEIITSTIMLLPQKAPMPGLVTRYNIPKGHDRVEIPRVGSTFTVQTPTEGDELVNSSQLDLTSTTIQPTHRAIMVRVHERPTYFSKDDIIGMVSELMAIEQARDIDTDLTAEFANISTSTQSTTNVALTLATLRTSVRTLYSNAYSSGGPAPSPMYCVIAPQPEEDLLTNIGLQGVVSSTAPWIPDGLSSDLMSRWGVPGGQLLGVPIFRDGYMTVDASGDFTCAMYSKQQLWLAVSKDWDVKTFEVPNWIGVIVRSVADYNSGLGAYSGWAVKFLADGD